jgi:hypothetical protein
MHRLRQKVADLKWVHDYRILKLRKAEQDARTKIAEADVARDAHDDAKGARLSVQDECLRRASAGQMLDPVLNQLWYRELERCERAEDDALLTHGTAKDEAGNMTAIWQQSLTIADHAAENLSLARRQWGRAKDQMQMTEAEELIVQRGVRQCG